MIDGTSTAEPPTRPARPREELRPVAPQESPSVETEGFESPRPLRDTLLMLGALPLPVALWATGVFPSPAALGVSSLLALLAALRGLFGAYDLHRSRRLGDALLRDYPRLPPFPGVAAWRAAELTGDRNRRESARLVRQLVLETEVCARSNPDGGAFATSLTLLRRLECRLESVSEPVSPLGMIELGALVGLSPFAFPERAAGLPAALVQALDALEPA